MAHLDRGSRRLELKLVYWGPARGGKTTSLRSVHAACDAAERGDLSSVDTEDERTYYFDYAPMNLPRYRDFSIRVHAYTVPGQEAYVETRRRILRGADGVIFVADASPAAAHATLSSWRQLDDCLRAIEGQSLERPVVVAVNKQDVKGAVRGEEMARRLAAAVPARPFVDVAETTAILGKGVVRCFRSALVAAADCALSAESSEGAAAARRQFLAALDARFRDGNDGAPIADAPPKRSVVVPISSNDPEAGGLLAAIESSRWLAVRDLDVKALQRERALGRLLLDLGQQCLKAADVESLARSVLAMLVMNLDAATGLIGVPDGEGGERVFDSTGVVAGGAAPSPESILLPFDAGGEQCGWVMLKGTPAQGLAPDTDAVLAPAGAFLGLALSRLRAAEDLRAANAMLEMRVEERTQELRREKEGLEARVAERTKDLERAKQATVEAERKIFDRERDEGVHRLAAGLAHELNNPVGAVQANLDFVREGLGRIAAGDGRASPDDVADLLAAVEDARTDTERVAASIRSLFGEAASARRAAVRTALSSAAREALRSWRDATPGAPEPQLVEAAGISVGIAPAECARWIFRILTVLGRGRAPSIRVEIDRGDDGPRLGVEADQPFAADAAGALEGLSREIAKAGGRLDAQGTSHRSRVRLVFPRAVGEVSSGVLEGAR